MRRKINKVLIVQKYSNASLEVRSELGPLTVKLDSENFSQKAIFSESNYTFKKISDPKTPDVIKRIHSA